MWKVTFNFKQSECPYYEKYRPDNYKCSNKNNSTSWRIINGICEKEFCPGEVGDY